MHIERLSRINISRHIRSVNSSVNKPILHISKAEKYYRYLFHNRTKLGCECSKNKSKKNLRMEYPLNVSKATLRDNIGQDYDKVADLGSQCKWKELLEFLKDRSLINSCRLPADSSSSVALCTPLHYAAKGKASKDVFEELLKLKASKTLKNAEGNTAYDIGKSVGLSDDILKLIEVPKEIRDKESEIKKMESGLHKVIRGRVDDLIKNNVQQLPQVAFLYEYGDFWYPVPGMYGGFSVSKDENGIQAESWCRVAGGSGQRHVIDKEGNVELVDEGFV